MVVGGSTQSPLTQQAQARVRASQAFTGALPVGRADRPIPDILRDRPQLRAANQLCPQLIEISPWCARFVVGKPSLQNRLGVGLRWWRAV